MQVIAVQGPATPYPTAGPIDVPQRILMGPGPSNSHPRALAAMALPQLGHMHPPFLKIMDDIGDYLRYLFQTDSKYTAAIAGCVPRCLPCALSRSHQLPLDNPYTGDGVWLPHACGG